MYLTSINQFFVLHCPYILLDVVHFLPRGRWGGCLLPLSILNLFMGRQVLWLLVWALLKYHHYWLLVLLLYQKRWYQTVQFCPLFLGWTFCLPSALTGFNYGSTFISWCLNESLLPIIILIRITVDPSELTISPSIVPPPQLAQV